MNQMPEYLRKQPPMSTTLQAVERGMQQNPPPQQTAPGPEQYARPQYEAVHPLNAAARLLDSLHYRHMREWGTELVEAALAKGFMIKVEEEGKPVSYREPIWSDFTELLWGWAITPPPEPPKSK